MTVKKNHMSKLLILYPPTQPLLEHDLPLWLEVKDEDEVYSTLLYVVEIVMGGKPKDEDDMIENLIYNPPPSVSPLEYIVRETQSNPSTDRYVANYTSLLWGKIHRVWRMKMPSKVFLGSSTDCKIICRCYDVIHMFINNYQLRKYRKAITSSPHVDFLESAYASRWNSPESAPIQFLHKEEESAITA